MPGPRPYDDPFAAEQLMAAFLHAPSGVAIVAADGRLLHVNPALARIVGRPEGELTTLRWQDLVDPRDRPGVEAAVTAAFTSTGSLDEVARIRLPDGRERELRVTARVVDATRSRPAGLVSHVVDITELVAAERELAHQAARLRRSNADLEAFAYAASHDLQEPLRSIVMAADAVLRSASGRLDGEERQLLAYVVDAASSMSDRVVALMEVARVRAAGPPEALVAAEGAVADAVAGLQSAINEAGAHIDVRAPLPAMPMPRDELALVLQNLIANAVKFRRPGRAPHVTVSGAERAGVAELEVADDGIGLSEADCARIFRPFQRASPGVAGTGVGLAVAHRIAERRHGSLTAASDGPGRGARFTLRLPRETG